MLDSLFKLHDKKTLICIKYIEHFYLFTGSFPVLITMAKVYLKVSECQFNHILFELTWHLTQELWKYSQHGYIQISFISLFYSWAVSSYSPYLTSILTRRRTSGIWEDHFLYQCWAMLSCLHGLQNILCQLSSLWVSQNLNIP